MRLAKLMLTLLYTLAWHVLPPVKLLASVTLVFHDFVLHADGLGGWSSEGCYPDLNRTTSTIVVCCCNHLTSFAVLLVRKRNYVCSQVRMKSCNTTATTIIKFSSRVYFILADK